MPGINDIVVVQEKDVLVAKNCPRVLVCKPSTKKNEICAHESIKLWFPGTKALVTKKGKESSAGGGHLDVRVIFLLFFRDHELKITQLEKGELVMIMDPGCDLTFEGGPHSVRHRSDIN
ncbi:unnamed protein product [Cylicostephanus goldi]|uniref:Uncharacterized protein n=1 Tax=Cylicostephanus goldi TaxID=71465 RepID=A0A3P6TL83_CYLGO|nr:unnamed protein product [Cylicostephanus goldi]